MSVILVGPHGLGRHKPLWVLLPDLSACYHGVEFVADQGDSKPGENTLLVWQGFKALDVEVMLHGI